MEVYFAEQRHQQGQLKSLLQLGEDIVHHSGHGNQVLARFQGFLVHSLSDEVPVSEGFEEGEGLVDGVGNCHLLVYEVL